MQAAERMRERHGHPHKRLWVGGVRNARTLLAQERTQVWVINTVGIGIQLCIMLKYAGC